MNYANADRGGNNPLFNRYSREYAESITGKMNFWLKFWREVTHQIHWFIENNFDKIEEETHSQSFFRKYLFDSNKYRLEKKDNKIVLSLK
jgi:hypothetical protein